MVSGSTESHYLIEKGEVKMDGDIYKDFERAKALCVWGKRFGVDSFIR